jgi:hypothetical protein
MGIGTRDEDWVARVKMCCAAYACALRCAPTWSGPLGDK